MRSVVSILLLVCFASYHFGYYLFYYSHQYHLESKWIEKIYTDQIEGLEERMMVIPLSAPYMSNQEHFQNTNTRFEKDGKFYRAIKQRYQNDSLEIIYVPDTARKSLESTVQKWISAVTDSDFDSEQSNSKSFKSFVKDYIQTVSHEFQGVNSKASVATLGFIFSPYQNPFYTLDSPPPQFLG